MSEANQGFAFKIQPCVLCAYDVDCDGVADLRNEDGCATHDVEPADLACAWFADLTAGREPASWRVTGRLIAAGHSGALVPSFAPGATHPNLVLWRWNDDPTRRVTVIDPDGRLPRDQRSWPTPTPKSTSPSG